MISLLATTPLDITWLVFSFAASSVICITYIPGAYKVIRTKDTRGISMWMYIFCIAACVLWVVAGVTTWINSGLDKGIAIVISNSFVMFCASLVLHRKWLNLRNAKKSGMTENDYVDQLIKGGKSVTK